MLFGKRGKSGLVALNLDLDGVAAFVKERLGKEVLYILSRYIYDNSTNIYNIDNEVYRCLITRFHLLNR